MKNDFNAEAEPEPRMVSLPAHTAHVFDWMSYRDDGMQGHLKGLSESAIQQQYYYDVNVPEQTVAFVSWEKLPYGMADDTKELLKRVMAEEDRAATAAITVKEPIVLGKALKFKGPGG